MIETFFGLARLGHTNAKGMPDLLQLALVTREFSDVIVFRSPPLAVHRVLFGLLTPIAHWRGYRATCAVYCTERACAEITDYFGAFGPTNFRPLGPVPLTWITVGSRIST
jgi:hypothetical protein